jgi:hypothetical protein
LKRESRNERLEDKRSEGKDEKKKAKSLFISRGACPRNDGNSLLPETREERHTCRAIHANATYSLPNLAREVDPRAGRSQDASCLINRRERVPMQDWDGLLLDSLAAAIRAILTCNTLNDGSFLFGEFGTGMLRRRPRDPDSCVLRGPIVLFSLRPFHMVN